jgi:hypothetical protein
VPPDAYRPGGAFGTFRRPRSCTTRAVAASKRRWRVTSTSTTAAAATSASIYGPWAERALRLAVVANYAFPCMAEDWPNWDCGTRSELRRQRARILPSGDRMPSAAPGRARRKGLP